MTTRRGFLGALLAAAAAPAFVRAEVLMPVRQIIVPDQEIAPPSKVWTSEEIEPAQLQELYGCSDALKQGDVFTIGGVAGMFFVSSVVTSSMTISPRIETSRGLMTVQKLGEERKRQIKANPSRVPILPGRGRWGA